MVKYINLLKLNEFNKLKFDKYFDVLNWLGFNILYEDAAIPASKNGEEMKWITLA